MIGYNGLSPGEGGGGLILQVVLLEKLPYWGTAVEGQLMTRAADKQFQFVHSHQIFSYHLHPISLYFLPRLTIF